MKNKWIKTVTAAMAAVWAAFCIVGCGTDRAEEQTHEEVTEVYEEPSYSSQDSTERPQAKNMVRPEGQQREGVQALDTVLFDGQIMSGKPEGNAKTGV